MGPLMSSIWIVALALRMHRERRAVSSPCANPPGGERDRQPDSLSQERFQLGPWS